MLDAGRMAPYAGFTEEKSTDCVNNTDAVMNR